MEQITNYGNKRSYIEDDVDNNNTAKRRRNDEDLYKNNNNNRLEVTDYKDAMIQIWVAVFCCLPVKDQIQARRVCKNWQNIFVVRKTFIFNENLRRNNFLLKTLNVQTAIEECTVIGLDVKKDCFVFLTFDQGLFVYNYDGKLRSFDSIENKEDKWELKSVQNSAVMENKTRNLIRSCVVEKSNKSDQHIWWQRKDFEYISHRECKEKEQRFIEILGKDLFQGTLEILDERDGKVYTKTSLKGENPKKISFNSIVMVQAFKDKLIFMNRKTGEIIEKSIKDFSLANEHYLYTLTDEYLILSYFSEATWHILGYSLKDLFTSSQPFMASMKSETPRSFYPGKSHFAFYTHNEISLFRVNNYGMNLVSTIKTKFTPELDEMEFEEDHFVVKHTRNAEVYCLTNGSKLLVTEEPKENICLVTYKEGIRTQSTFYDNRLWLTSVKRFF